MNRNHFLKSFGMGAIVSPFLIKNLNFDSDPPLEKELVQEFVRIAHSDKTQVMAMLDEHPTLLNAAHDWGHGDFETALGAASHVGHKELVLYLIKMGAQTNIFTACLFGHLDIVKLALDIFPDTLHAKGPHGFTLLHHANKGGNESLEVKAFLESLGAVDTKIALY